MNDLKDFLHETAAELSLPFPPSANVIKACKGFVERMRDLVFEQQYRLEQYKAQFEAQLAQKSYADPQYVVENQSQMYQYLISDLRAASYEDQSNHYSVILELNYKFSELQYELSALYTAKTGLYTYNADLYKQKVVLEAYIAASVELEAYVAELMSADEEYQSYISELSKQLNSANKRYTEMQDEIDAFRGEIAMASNEVAQANIKHEHAERESDSLRAYIGELYRELKEAKREAVEQNNDEYIIELTRLNGALNVKIEQYSEEIKELEQIEQYFNELYDYVKELTLENEKLAYGEGFYSSEVERQRVAREIADNEAVYKIERYKSDFEHRIAQLTSQIEAYLEEMELKNIALEGIYQYFSAYGVQMEYIKNYYIELSNLYAVSQEYQRYMREAALQEKQMQSNEDLLTAVEYVYYLYAELALREQETVYLREHLTALQEYQAKSMVSSDVVKLDESYVEITVLYQYNQMLLKKLVDIESEYLDVKVDYKALQLSYNKIDQLYYQNKQLVRELYLLYRQQRETAIRPVPRQYCDNCERCTYVAQTLKYYTTKLTTYLSQLQKRSLAHLKYFLQSINRIRAYLKYARDPRVAEIISNLRQLQYSPIEEYMDPLIDGFCGLYLPYRVIETDKSRSEVILLYNKIQASNEFYGSYRALIYRLTDENANLRYYLEDNRYYSTYQQQIYETRIGRLVSESAELQLSQSAPQPEPQPEPKYQRVNYGSEMQTSSLPKLCAKYNVDLLMCLVPVLRLSVQFLMQAKSYLTFDLRQVRLIYMYFEREIDRVRLFVLGAKQLSGDLEDVRKQARELEIVLLKYYK